MKEIYIHFGDSKYEKAKFNEIRNIDFVKPYGGLWASSLNAKYGWKKFCENNLLSEIDLSNYFLFKLKLVLNKDVIKEMNENEIEGSTNCLFS